MKLATNVYEINAEYYTRASSTVELPEGKTWDDVEEWWIRYDVLHYRLAGETEFREADLNSDIQDGTDWKRPLNVSIHPVSVDGVTDYDTIVDDPLEGADK